MTRFLPITLLAFLLTACVPPIVVRDYDSSCRVAAQMMNEPLTGPDLIELTAPFPRIYADAVRAYRARIAAIVLTVFGGAGLVGGFVTGFAADTTNPAVRAALGTDIGVTVALGVGAGIAAWAGGKAHQRALQELERVVRTACP
jgi:hypothetical protein